MHLKICRYTNAENVHFTKKNGLWKNLGTYQTYWKCILNLLEDPSFFMKKKKTHSEKSKFYE